MLVPFGEPVSNVRSVECPPLGEATPETQIIDDAHVNGAVGDKRGVTALRLAVGPFQRGAGRPAENARDERVSAWD